MPKEKAGQRRKIKKLHHPMKKGGVGERIAEGKSRARRPHTFLMDPTGEVLRGLPFLDFLLGWMYCCSAKTKGWWGGGAGGLLYL